MDVLCRLIGKGIHIMHLTGFLNSVMTIAQKHGWKIERNRDGLMQIDFGNKKLHAPHLAAMHPEILKNGASIAAIVEKVAPGRP